MHRSIVTFSACAIVVAIVAFGGGQNTPGSTPYGQAGPTASTASAALVLPTDPQQRPVQVVTPHVFVIVMENTGGFVSMVSSDAWRSGGMPHPSDRRAPSAMT